MKAGTRAPGFTLKNTEGKDVSLADLIKDKSLVLFFFPLAFSGVCTKEMCIVRDNMKMYKSLNAHVAGISVDSFYALHAFKKAENLNFLLLSDFNKEVSRLYNSFYQHYFDMKGVAKRSVFVIDKERKIRHRQILDDSDSLPDFGRVLKSLQEIH